MVTIYAISLPESSPFRDANQIPLLDDPPIEVQANDQSEDAEEEEGEDRLDMRELS